MCNSCTTKADVLTPNLGKSSVLTFRAAAISDYRQLPTILINNCFSQFSRKNVNICWSLSFMIVNEEPFGFGMLVG